MSNLMNNTPTPIQSHLFSLKDEAYKAFQSALMPTVCAERNIGVRTPALRAYAKNIKNTPLATEFLKELPHFYYEENNLHAFLIADYEGQALFDALDAFLPHVDNWATCDSLRPKYFKKDKTALRTHIERWFHAPHLYTRRFAIEALMLHFLEDGFEPTDPMRLSAINSHEYYEQMMIAWYFAEALCRRYEEILPYFTAPLLKEPILKMARQKALDSKKLTEEQKAVLRKA
ncbi:MAG: DNA alkylation repair protein [Clostridia bacterium]|nr:DNA alkylation repair protein [Clostridia bacterium]